jgi:hypothetical protein
VVYKLPYAPIADTRSRTMNSFAQIAGKNNNVRWMQCPLLAGFSSHIYNTHIELTNNKV